MSSFKFSRLLHYFSEGLLSTASVVPTDRLPVPALSALGLKEFADFETQPMDGITYQDTYFVRTSAATDESLHFHELVHVVQWQVLGQKEFLLLYATGLAEHGYRECPLEATAFEHQERFDSGRAAIFGGGRSVAADVGFEDDLFGALRKSAFRFDA